MSPEEIATEFGVEHAAAAELRNKLVTEAIVDGVLDGVSTLLGAYDGKHASDMPLAFVEWVRGMPQSRREGLIAAAGARSRLSVLINRCSQYLLALAALDGVLDLKTVAARAYVEQGGNCPHACQLRGMGNSVRPRRG